MTTTTKTAIRQQQTILNAVKNTDQHMHARPHKLSHARLYACVVSVDEKALAQRI